jgi:ABC-type transport system substrate-binding protein
MKMKLKSLFLTLGLLAAISLMVVQIVPAKAWVVTPTYDDENFELYGPHVKGILMPIYSDEVAEWTDMLAGHLDIEDWPLTKAYYDQFVSNPDFVVTNYGGEAGYFILDINNNETLPDGSPNPCTVLEFRQALAYLVNRTYIIYDITKGFGLPMWTPVPTYMTTYVHPEIKPGGSLEALTYGGMTGDIAAAAQLLDTHGFPKGPDGWRYWDRNHNGAKDPGEDLKLIFYARSDDISNRLPFADNYKIKLESEPIKIHVDYRPNVRKVCSDSVMGAKNFHLYTGGWIFIGPDPDYLYDLYHSTMYWHPGKPPNYDNIHDSLLDEYLEHIKYATTYEEGTYYTMKAQERFAACAFSVPLWCSSGTKAYKKVPVEASGQEWRHLVNQQGFGVNSWWSTLNMITNTTVYPPIYIHYGFKSDVEKLNPVYAEWYWDWEVLGRIYDGGAARNPYSLGEWIPQLYEKWTAGVWYDSVAKQNKTKVTITLRPDIYWQDGTPLTINDVYYTLVEISKDLIAKDLPTPWWYPTVEMMKSVYIVNPYTIEILLDVQSVWAVGWVIGNVVIPKHIWKPLVDASTPENMVVYGAQPDPNVVGSGPFKFKEHTTGVRVVLDANPNYWQYTPIKVFVDIPGKFDAGTRTFSVKISNLCKTDSMSIHKTVTIDGSTVADITATIAAGDVHTEDITYNFAYGKHTIQVTVDWNVPSVGSGTKTYTLKVYTTIKEDIAGSTYYDDTGFSTYKYKSELPTPDIKVDIKDVAGASKAFGTYPGHSYWNPVADINGDYKADIKDVAAISKKFGWAG